jgi:Alpha-L-arabinofuranosidase B (ABFB) domain
MPQFQSFNFRDRFIRHRSFEGVLIRKQDPGGPEADFSFVVVDRGAGRISLRSENFPDRFPRHRDFRIMLEKSAGPADQLFRQDSTFFLEPGLAAANGVSFRSFNLPDLSDGCAVAWGLLACRPAGDRVAAGAALPDQPPLPRTDRPIRIPQGPDAVGGSSA